MCQTVLVFRASLPFLNVSLMEVFEHAVSNPIFPVSPVGFIVWFYTVQWFQKPYVQLQQNWWVTSSEDSPYTGTGAGTYMSGNCCFSNSDNFLLWGAHNVKKELRGGLTGCVHNGPPTLLLSCPRKHSDPSWNNSSSINMLFLSF